VNSTLEIVDELICSSNVLDPNKDARRAVLCRIGPFSFISVSKPFILEILLMDIWNDPPYNEPSQAGTEGCKLVRLLYKESMHVK
jgi:hypothetical protein